MIDFIQLHAAWFEALAYGLLAFGVFNFYVEWKTRPRVRIEFETLTNQEGRTMAQEWELRQRIANARRDVEFCVVLWELDFVDDEIDSMFADAERRLRAARRELQDVRCEGR